MPTSEQLLTRVHARLKACGKCPRMCGPPVHGPALDSRILLVGQAPGAHEGRLGKPFAYTAGKTLFKWLGQATGADEDELRRLVYFAAIARCFPGKNKKGAGDRPPNAGEITNCREFLVDEVAALKPRVILAVGRTAITEVLGPQRFAKTATLESVVGRKFRVSYHGQMVDVIPLPHPSGVSRWPVTEPGRTLLTRALALVTTAFRRHAG